MKHVGLVILAVLLLFAPSTCGAARIAEEQAAEAVRAFEGDPNLQFWRIEVYEQNEGPSWSHFANYTLEAGTHDNPIADYSVDTTTGEVNVTYRLRGQHPIKEAAETLTKEQCKQTAEAFARAKYQGFESMGFSLKTELLDEGTWRFRWQQVLDYGAMSMNYVEVEIRAADGRVSSYDTARYPVVRPQEPLISSEQAVRTAMHSAGITDMTEVPETALRVDPIGTTFWTIYIQGLNAEGFDVCYYADVDAGTGEVLRSERTDYGADPELDTPRDPPEVIPPGEAREAVKAWESNQDLVLICRKLDATGGSGHWDDEWFYDVDDRDNDDRSWQVSAVTGEVTHFIDLAAFPDEEWEEPAGRLTSGECQEIAERFARAKYGGFADVSFIADDPEWERDGWRFSWNEKVECEPCVSSYVSVTVNAEDGRIESYGASRVAPFTPLEARVTAEQAVELAMTATGIVRLGNDPEPELSAYPGATIWYFDVQGPDAKGRTQDYAAKVNAVTGEIIGLYEAYGASAGALAEASSHRADTESEELMPIRELVAQIPGASVHWLGKQGAKIFSGRNRYHLLPGSDTIEWTGGQIKLSRKMILEDGRLMVSTELVQAVVKTLLPPTPPEAPSDE